MTDEQVFLPLSFQQGLFSEVYKPVELLRERKSTLTRVYIYKRENTGHRIIVKTMPNTADTYKELRIADFVNKTLRSKLGLDVFIQTIGYVLELHPYPEDNLPPDVFEGEFFIYMATEYVPYNFDTAKIMIRDAESIFMELLATFYRARKAAQFHHGDLHIQNILLDKVGETRGYTVGDKYYETSSKWMPRVIDFGKNATHGKKVTKVSDLKDLVTLISDVSRKLDPEDTTNPAHRALLAVWRKWQPRMQWNSATRSFGGDDNTKYENVARVLDEPVFERFLGQSTKRVRLKTCIQCKEEEAVWRAVTSEKQVFCSNRCAEKYYR